jgi:integrase
MKTVKPGIRLKSNGNYIATKSIDGKRYYKEFSTLREAEIWKNKFHPLANKSPAPNRPHPTLSSANEFVNGRDQNVTVREVYEKYLKGPLKTFCSYSRYKIPKRMERFLPPIFSLRMCELTPDVITDLLAVSEASVDPTYGRQSFKEELKYLKAILNWYRNEKDFTFNVPITKYHYKSFNRVVAAKRKHLPVEDVVRFIANLEENLAIMATLQFLYALRIGEVCALSTDTVNLGMGTIHIRQTITWLKDRPVLKETTKTEDEATLKMTPEVIALVSRLDAKRPSGCRFFFHQNGKMPRYRPIVDAYNAALDAIGIKDVRGSHFLRHSAATLSRKSGGIDAAQAILRHKSATMAQHYAKLDLNEKASEVVIHAEKVFLEASRATNATKSLEMLAITNS